MSEIGAARAGRDAGPDRRQDGPVAGVDVRPRPRRRGLADRRRPASATGSALLPGAWAIPITLRSARSSAWSTALLIVRFGLNGFIVTLGMLIMLRGLLTGISGGQTFFDAARRR